MHVDSENAALFKQLCKFDLSFFLFGMVCCLLIVLLWLSRSHVSYANSVLYPVSSTLTHARAHRKGTGRITHPTSQGTIKDFGIEDITPEAIVSKIDAASPSQTASQSASTSTSSSVPTSSETASGKKER